MLGYCNDCDMYDKTKECPNWNRCFRAFNKGREYTEQDVTDIKQSIKTLELKPGKYYFCEVNTSRDAIQAMIDNLRPIWKETGVANIIFAPKGIIADLEEKSLFIKHLSFTHDETGQAVVKDRFKSDEFAEDYKTYSDIMFTALTELTNANLFGNYKIIIAEEK
jgi:hypothetical protein